MNEGEGGEERRGRAEGGGRDQEGRTEVGKGGDGGQRGVQRR